MDVDTLPSVTWFRSLMEMSIQREVSSSFVRLTRGG